MTRNEIQSRMLGNISDKYDKSEGSFFFDPIAAVTIELEKSYEEQGVILTNAFVSTAGGEYLERKCAELGIERKAATKAAGTVEITGAVGAKILQGNLVSTELVTYVITENKTIGASGKESVSIECSQAGTIGNVPVGAIKYFPVTLEGILSVTNPSAMTSGYDRETDDSLRKRFYDKVNSPATSGNVGHYKQWAKSVTGVGEVKVIPTWNGAGTVKVVLCNANMRAADSGLINATSTYIETQRPIGAKVTVVSASEKTISITATIVLGNGRTLEEVKADFEKAVTNYFKEIAFTGLYVSYAKVGSILYDIYGVSDYSNLKLNGASSNIVLTDMELPVVGTVVFS